MAAATIVIVGAGLAGATAAETLRAEGFDGRVVLIGAEAHPPYIRPPLSKGVLLGLEERDSAFVHETSWYGEQGVELVTGDAAEELDLTARTVVTASGREFGYDRLLIATGATPRRLSVPGADAGGIHYLRTLSDSDALRDALSKGGKRVVSVGSGWIGLEVTAAARTYGNEVTVIAPETIPLASALGDALGAVFQRLHEGHGVQFLMQTNTTAFEVDDGRVTGVTTDAGTTVPADVVVVGIGAAPSTALAEGAGLETENGILADASLQTSDPSVFVAGDIANAFHPVLGIRLRSEHWANAIAQGNAVARSMLGQNVSFDEVPYFYTDQYDLGMEYAGYFTLARNADVVYRGDVDSGEFIAFWTAGDRVVGGMNVNVWDVNDDIKALVASGRAVDVGRLRDPSIPITEL